MKFFTYKELQSGIPTKNDVAEAGRILSSVFSKNFATDALLYGSLAKGTYNERSDLDMIVIVPDSQYIGTLLGIQITFEKIHPAISTKNLLIIPESITETQLNFLPSYLMENIRTYHQNIIGDVFKKITPVNVSPEESFLGYLQQKTRKCLTVLSHEKSMSEESVMDALDSIFCAPQHIIRNFMFVLDRASVEPVSFEMWMLENLKPLATAKHMVGLMKSMQQDNYEYTRCIKEWNTYFILPDQYDGNCRCLLHSGTHMLLEFLKAAHEAYQYCAVKK